MSDDSPTPVVRALDPELRSLLERSRVSSQGAMHRAQLVALEVLRMLGVSEEDEDAFLEPVAAVLRGALQDHAEQYNAMLSRQVADHEVAMADLRMKAKMAVRSATAMRRAILDFIGDGDLERLSRRVKGL